MIASFDVGTWPGALFYMILVMAIAWVVVSWIRKM